MKNKLTDLNNHLFAQLERLGDEALSDEALRKEVTRSKALTGVASQIVDNARLALDAEKFKQDFGGKNHPMPTMLEVNNG